MKRIVTAFAAVLMLTGFACTAAPDSVLSPVEPMASSDGSRYADECHGNMYAVAMQQCIYYAVNGSFASTLEELGFYSLTCRECNLEYLMEGDERTFSIRCPLPSDPTHGSIVDGVATWTPGPQEPVWICRANMRLICMQCVIFFAINSRYPESLEEIGMSNFICPECGNPYVFIGSRWSFFIECGKPEDPNHGYILDGVPSWLQ